ncbi:hypothetical protein Desaci_2893 [Desulfosporosinus acidiphilus SJ4]|uniref:Uncharacterized protein n=1 Tax=Desulfosporosinus acidiphilus (strain DSM 22704 / JCM 16185 / SJ4) TaxID=646529 RepID=I4D7N1_DESAJ|nr:hypothetical protein [Desulfosporosinus acidiphilus]AFM41805.1 hypothetical protein Desaci_2893 [Desulfosporosinus acidiphilus SJ4]
MVAQIFESCQRISFQVNLFELLEVLSILVLILVIVLLQKKILSTVRKESIIDERVRETSARIARVVAEIEQSIEGTKGDTQVPSHTLENTVNELNGPLKAEAVNSPKGKKTRAMSMEERWAEFEKKRGMRSSASG